MHCDPTVSPFCFVKAKANEATRKGVIAWTPTLHRVIQDAASIKRPSKRPPPASVYVFPYRYGQAYTGSGFKAMWAKIMGAWLSEDENRERFTFHDLRAYYVTALVEEERNPETHANPATTRKVYDRRRVVKVMARK